MQILLLKALAELLMVSCILHPGIRKYFEKILFLLSYAGLVSVSETLSALTKEI